MTVVTLEEFQAGVRHKLEHWDEIPGLPNIYGIELGAFRIGEASGLSKHVTPKQIADAVDLSGPVGTKARKARAHLKACYLFLLEYDDERWFERYSKYRWKNAIMASAANSGVPVIPEHYWVNEVKDHFDDLMPHISFWSKARASDRIRKAHPHDNGERLAALMEDDVRVGANEALAEFVEAKLGGKGAAPKTAQSAKPSRDKLKADTKKELLKRIEKENIPAKAIAKRHGFADQSIEAMLKGEIYTICCDHYGYVGDLVAKEGE